MSIKLVGLDKVLKNLDKQTEAIKKQVDVEMTEAANAIEERAKILAPVDRGQMRSAIFADTDVPFVKRVVAPINHSPYVEFGTKRYFNPNGRGSYASQFKGKGGGTFEEFVKNMYGYLKRKGWPSNIRGEAAKQNYARHIAIRIAKNGIKPQPYFFRAYDEIVPTLIRKLQSILK
jgi:hypothetical protein